MTTTTLVFGDLRTGRVTDTVAATSCNWLQTINTCGQIDQVQVPGAEVRSKRLRRECMAGRSFLAVDVDGVLQEAGPVWSRTWDDEANRLTLGAAGLWSLWDHRMVIPVLAAGQKVQAVTTAVAGTDLGGIARAMVAQAMTHTGGAVPLVLPPATVGDRTETFPGWQLLNLGDQLRQLTKRQFSAPDIRFRPRWTSSRLGVEWGMEVGTGAQPLLTQLGQDWFFDASVPRGPVAGITTDEDATVMGSRGWVTGNGMEADILIGASYRPDLVDAGWPLLELEESRSTTTDQATLDYYADALTSRSSRPVEVWTVRTTGAAARDVLAGDYARVVPRPDDPWLGDVGQAYMRVKSKSGTLQDQVKMIMYSVSGQVS